MTDMFTDGLGDSSESTDTEMADTQTTSTPQPTVPPPSTDYRNLLLRVGGIDPRIIAQVEPFARGFTNNVKSFVAATPDVRDKPLTTAPKDRKRKLVGEVVDKLAKVRKERVVLGRNYGTLPPPTPVPPPLPGKSKAKKKPSAPKKVPQTVVQKKSVELVQGEEGVARPYGHHKGAFNLNESGVLPINPSVQIGAQTRQYLTHVSELFFAKVSTMEVEGMQVNDRLLVSANETSTVSKIAQLKLGDLLQEAAEDPTAEVDVIAGAHKSRRYRIGVLGEALKLIDEGELTETQLKGVEVLAEAQAGFHLDYDARPMLESFVKTLQVQVRTITQVQGPFSIAEAAKKINDDAFKHTVIAVNALEGGKSHAEQHLALAYLKSQNPGPAVVAGTKIPCAVCWLSLALVHQAGRNLDFNNTPGGLWDTTVFRGLSAIATELKIVDVTQLWASFVQAYDILPGGDQFVQYLTALHEQTALTVTIPKKGGGLKEKGYTQDISGLSREFIEGRPQSPLGSPFREVPDSPRGSYGTPTHTDEETED
jgi:hypothetical protein